MTVPSPFEATDDPADTCLLLVNDAGQRSVWPAFAAIPDGWSVQSADPAEVLEAVQTVQAVHPEGDSR
jgi:MbtH protein